MRSLSRLLTPFIFAVGILSAKVHALPRPEHPRPDSYRTNWMSLNGEWQDGFARGKASGQDLEGRITVPFCPESKLSGLNWGNTNYFENAWYRRMIELPASMTGKRVLIHFGAVDYKTWVYVNGQQAGIHVGGGVAFAFEITKLLHAGQNEVVVRIFDSLRSGSQPGGKQSPVKSEGCNYTRTTGIWQPVWLEAVGESYVEGFSVVPDPDHSRVLIEADVNGVDNDVKLVADAYADGKLVGSDSSSGTWRNHRLVVNLKKKKLLEPGSPFLYDLKFSLYHGNEKVDEVGSYFGLRKVSIDGRRILINDKPVFQRLILDQGFYPDGIWTAPSEEALKHDIEMSMAAGYNGARLHQKVFEPRFLYWADKLGYMVWGEFPNWGFNYNPAAYAAYLSEWTEEVIRDRNHPSIVGWCPFNETGDKASELQQLVWHTTKAVDPTRPLLETSGYTHSLANAEVRDSHDYEDKPGVMRKHWNEFFNGHSGKSGMPQRYSTSVARGGDLGVPYMISEIGGIGWGTEGGWGYGNAPKEFDQFSVRYQGTLEALLDNPNLFGFCYTQLTDIEQERNGLYYYDRRPKFDLAKLHAITTRTAAYERGLPSAPQPVPPKDPWKVLAGAVQDGKLCTPWHYSTQTPAAAWSESNFDDSSWTTGSAPFGHEEKSFTRTSWTDSDIYLRKTFQYNGEKMEEGSLMLSTSGSTEVYVNGSKVYETENRNHRYFMNDITDALGKSLHAGANTLCVHVHQKDGGQFIDAGLIYH